MAGGFLEHSCRYLKYCSGALPCSRKLHSVTTDRELHKNEQRAQLHPQFQNLLPVDLQAPPAHTSHISPISKRRRNDMNPPLHNPTISKKHGSPRPQTPCPPACPYQNSPRIHQSEMTHLTLPPSTRNMVPRQFWAYNNI